MKKCDWKIEDFVKDMGDANKYWYKNVAISFNEIRGKNDFTQMREETIEDVCKIVGKTYYKRLTEARKAISLCEKKIKFFKTFGKLSENKIMKLVELNKKLNKEQENAKHVVDLVGAFCYKIGENCYNYQIWSTEFKVSDVKIKSLNDKLPKGTEKEKIALQRVFNTIWYYLPEKEMDKLNKYVAEVVNENKKEQEMEKQANKIISNC